MCNNGVALTKLDYHLSQLVGHVARDTSTTWPPQVSVCFVNLRYKELHEGTL